jgi:DNA-binding beta-propeller fold protein YncE
MEKSRYFWTTLLTNLRFLAVAAVVPIGAATHVLPTGWKIADYTGRSVQVGTMPVGLALSSDGRYVYVTENGFNPAGLRVLDAENLNSIAFVPLPAVFGRPVPDADGIWIATGSTRDNFRLTFFTDQIVHIHNKDWRVDKRFYTYEGFFPASVSLSPDGHHVAAPGELADAVVIMSLRTGSIEATIKVGNNPWSAVWSADSESIYISDTGGDAIDVVDLRTNSTQRIPVGHEPTQISLSLDGEHLFIAETGEDRIAILNTRSKAVERTFYVGLKKEWGLGSLPSSLRLSRDGKLLAVACSGINAVFVYRIVGTDLDLVAALPTGWYPTDVAFTNNGKSIFVTDGKGWGSRPNPEYRPYGPPGFYGSGYQPGTRYGRLEVIDIPPATALSAALSRLLSFAPAYALTPEQAKQISPSGVIKHVIYVVKRHRSYDQVFGDVDKAQGDPGLAEFGSNVTPNLHALAKRFGLYDNFYTVGLDTGDDLNWVMSGYVTDYIERTLPAFLGGRSWVADFRGRAKPAVSPSYLWDNALDHGISIRNYGFFLESPQTSTRLPVYKGTNRFGSVTSEEYGGIGELPLDQDRLAVWQREFDAYVASDSLPQLQLVLLPGDQAITVQITDRTPRAYVADNDLAVGKLVESVSHSKYWRDTAILIAEDDSQYGPDHVDSQRSTFLVVSPYSTPGVHHEWLNLLSVTRTVELLLGLPSMSMYDATAVPLFHSFQASPDPSSWNHLPSNIDILESRFKAFDPRRN